MIPASGSAVAVNYGGARTSIRTNTQDAALWYGLPASANTPKPIVQRLHAQLTRIISLPAVSQQWAALGAEGVSPTPGQFAAFLNHRIVKWRKVVRDSGARRD